jgi:hypothetical protein
LGLHAQPVLLRGLDLELSEPHERIGRRREILRLLERDAPHARRSAISGAWQDIDRRGACDAWKREAWRGRGVLSRRNATEHEPHRHRCDMPMAGGPTQV